MLGEHEAAFGRGDGASQFLRGRNPLPDDHFHVRQSLLVCLAIRGAAGQFGNLGDERLVFLTPIDNDLVPSLGIEFSR